MAKNCEYIIYGKEMVAEILSVVRELPKGPRKENLPKIAKCVSKDQLIIASKL